MEVEKELEMKRMIITKITNNNDNDNHDKNNGGGEGNPFGVGAGGPPQIFQHNPQTSFFLFLLFLEPLKEDMNTS